MGNRDGSVFLLKMITCQKNIILTGIMSAMIYKKEFKSRPVYNINFSKTKIISHGNKVADFYEKEVPKVNSNNICLYD